MASEPTLRRRRTWRVLLALTTATALLFSGSAGYTVRAGDTLWGIAARHGVSLSALTSVNRLRNPNVILPGTQLRIPSRRAVAAARTSTASSGTARIHVVAPGETLMDISIRSGVLMRDIAAANRLSNLHLVFAGQRLRIPTGTKRVVSRPAGPAAPSAAPVTSARADVGRMLERTARAYGFSPAFVKALAYQESGWNQSARSSAGAVGVMQVLPSTGDFVERYVVGRPLNIHNTQDNITAGVAFLDHLWRLTGGSPQRTLAGYYQGLRSVQERGMYPSTRTYIANVLALRNRFR